VEDGIVPSVNSRSISSRSSSMSLRHYYIPGTRITEPGGPSERRTIRQSPLVPQQASSVPHLGESTTRPRTTTREVGSPSPALIPSPAPQTGESSSQPVEIIPKTRGPSPPSSHSPLAGPSEVQVREVPNTATSAISAPLSPTSDGTYIGVREHMQRLHVPIDNTTARLQGNIVTRTGSFPVDAYFLPDLAECLISRAFASRLGLVIVPRDFVHGTEEVEHDTRITFNGEAEQEAVGRVTISWAQVVTGPVAEVKSFSVVCLVFAEAVGDDVNLVLGKPYVDKKRHYWEGNASTS